MVSMNAGRRSVGGVSRFDIDTGIIATHMPTNEARGAGPRLSRDDMREIDLRRIGGIRHNLPDSAA